MAWMLEEDADYAVFFPDFSATYTDLANDPRLEEVHCTDYTPTRALGHNNMCVYQVKDGD
jgi:hypothetical protein